jgi:hypothetical protein
MKTLTLLAIVLASRLSLTRADSVNATTPNRRHCIDPVRFDKCFSNAANTQLGCVKAAKGDSTTVTNCQQSGQETKLNCFLSYCWNKVRPFCKLFMLTS